MEGLMKSMINAVKIIGVLTEIQTRHLHSSIEGITDSSTLLGKAKRKR
jgi:hypothetical protein